MTSPTIGSVRPTRDQSRERDSRVVIVKLSDMGVEGDRKRHGSGARGLAPAARPLDSLLARHDGAQVRPLFESRSSHVRASARSIRAYLNGELEAPPDAVAGKSTGDWRYLELVVPTGLRRDEVLEELQRDSRVEFAFAPPSRQIPKVRRSVHSLTSPLATHQWYLGAAGFGALWERVQGNPWPAVAVLDTGVQRHPDLDDVVDPDVRAKSAIERHATYVCGILAAQADNGIGIVGASRSRVHALRVHDGDDLLRAEYYAALKACAHDGVKVINISLESHERDLMEEECIAECIAAGCVVVAAAGNHGDDEPTYPAVLPGVIGVGAHDASNAVWKSSGRGDNVWIAAPGVRMRTTGPAKGYDTVTGTSFAAPLVAAAAAGLFALDPGASRSDVINALRTLTSGGGAQRRPDIGFGRLDLRGI